MKALGLVALIGTSLGLRQPLLVILLAVAAAVHLLWGRGNLEDIVEDMWVGLDKEVILSIPLFILCGGIMTRGSIAQRLIRILAALTKPIPGGLAVATVLSCAVFAAISGSSIVTMLAIGTVMYPAMRQAGYDNKFSLGAIMSGGTLGIVIPPSIPMIIYGLVTETSVTDLFVAGFGPGLLITLALSAYSVWFNWGMPTVAFDFSEFWLAFKHGVWAALMPVILLGGIYSGYFTATEAAAVALAYALLIEVFVHRELKLGDFYKVVLDTSRLGGSLFPLIAVALSLNIILTEHRAPQALVDFNEVQRRLVDVLDGNLQRHVAAEDRFGHFRYLAVPLVRRIEGARKDRLGRQVAARGAPRDGEPSTGQQVLLVARGVDADVLEVFAGCEWHGQAASHAARFGDGIEDDRRGNRFFLGAAAEPFFERKRRADRGGRVLPGHVKPVRPALRAVAGQAGRAGNARDWTLWVELVGFQETRHGHGPSRAG